MEFGKVSPEELDSVSFKLPPDREETTQLLSRLKNNTPTQVYVGCAKWGRKDWVGKIYPQGTKEADFLPHYAQHFNCIELNATFYRIPTRTQTKNWQSKVGDDFQFCPKFSQGITHIRRLKDAAEITDRFLEGVSGFGKNLGPVFLMPHPGMGPKTLDTIQAFIESLPKDIRLFVELRHKDWFENPDAFKKMFDIFEKTNAGSVITDASGRRDCVHMRLTTSDAFIRFVGNGLHPSDYTRVDDWVNRIKTWMDQGIKNVYFFMHQHEEVHSPELGGYVIQRLNAVCGTKIPEPIFVDANAEVPLVAKPKKKPAAKK
jgi:uncharacterized protein YecE (DUF72 family)